MRPKGTTKNGLKYLDESQLKEFSQTVKKGSLRDFVMFLIERMSYGGS